MSEHAAHGHGEWADGWDLLEKANELSGRGEEIALATVVWRQGPSSGQQGSRAIVTAGGDVHGWIGGACAEPVVIREAQRVIQEREAKLLLLGTPEQFGTAVPEGITIIPIACQSEGALEVFIEPVVPMMRLVVVGRSPMAHTLGDLAAALGWRSEVLDAGEFAATDVDARTLVVVAMQGNGDEEAIEQAVRATPAFVGLVASRRRGEAVLGYLEERGVPRPLLERVHVPVGLDLGHTTHREIAVSVLAELVQLRAAGSLAPVPSTDDVPAAQEAATAIDPVCGMTVAADPSSHPLVHDGVTYYFCHVGCRDRFEADPSAYLSVDQEA
jgi:xanthine dehydrogenase accessory factor